MKKKLLKGMLMAVVAVASMSFFVSCTDHEDDRFTQMAQQIDGKYATKVYVDGEISNLQNQITALQLAQKNCSTNCAFLKSELSKYLLKTDTAEIYTWAKATFYRKDQTYSKAEIDAMLKNYLSVTPGSTTTFTADDIEDLINFIQNEYQDYNTFITNVFNNTEYTTQITHINDSLKNLQHVLDSIENVLKTKVDDNGFISRDSVMTLISEAIKGLTPCGCGFDPNDYFKKDEITGAIHDSIAKLGYIYNESEILAIANKILKDWATKAEADSISRAVFNSLIQKYYTKTEIDSLFKDLGLDKYVQKNDTALFNSYAQLFVTENNFINKDEIEKYLGVNYYNKLQVDSIISATETKISQNYVAISMLDSIKNVIYENIFNNNTFVTNLSNYLDDNGYINSLDTMAVTNFVDSILGFQTFVTTTNSSISGIIERLKALEAYDNKGVDSTLNAAIEALKISHDSLNLYKGWLITNSQYQIADVLAEATEAKTLAKWDSMQIAKLDSLYKVLEDSLSNYATGHTLIDSCSQIRNDLNSLAETVAANKAEADANYKKADSLANKALEGVSDLTKELQQVKDSLANYATIELLNTEIQKLDSILRDAIKEAVDPLKDDIKNLQNDVKKNSDDIKDIYEKLKKMLTPADVQKMIKEALAKKVTSVNVNGAYSPMFGEGALPLGVQLNMLVAYYGYVSDDMVEFPSAAREDLANQAEVNIFTQADLDILNTTILTPMAGSALYNESVGAGKLYFTVNPVNIDFSGLDISLENSRGIKNAIQLDNVRLSNHLLTFGYTRSNGGFYEADATLDVDNVNTVQARIDLGDIKDLASDFKDFVDDLAKNKLKSTKQLSVSKTISILYESFNEVLDRYCIAVENTETGDKVRSDYSIGAVAVKPLSFYNGTLAKYNRDHVPYIWRVEKFIGNVLTRISNKIADQMPTFNFELSPLEIQKIELKELSEDLVAKFIVKLDTTINTPAMSLPVGYDTIIYINPVVDLSNPILDEQGQPIDITIEQIAVAVSVRDNVEVPSKPIEITIHYDLRNEIKEVYGMTQDAVKDINDMIEDINEWIGQLDDIMAELDKVNSIDDNIRDVADNFKKDISRYINKFNNRFKRFFADLNNYLQITMFGAQDGGYRQLSPAFARPSRLTSSTIKFLPYGMNAEIISPAYKKFIGITNVWKGNKSAKSGDAECLNELRRANSQPDMNEPFDGGKVVVPFEASKGYKYEVVYGALDYHGKAQYRKYYIEY